MQHIQRRILLSLQLTRKTASSIRSHPAFSRRALLGDDYQISSILRIAVLIATGAVIAVVDNNKKLETNASACAPSRKNETINETIVEAYRLRTGLKDATRFQRIDEDFLTKPAFLQLITDNLFHDTLRHEGMIEMYEVYRKLGEDEIYAIVRFGSRLNGHPGIVHGGITSTAFDNTFGWLFFALGVPAAFTAYLHVNFRKQIPANSYIVIKARLQSKERRKLFMTATMEDFNGSILADSDSLFISVEGWKLFLYRMKQYFGLK